MYKLEDRLKKVLEELCTSHMATPEEYEVIVGLNAIGRPYGIVIWNRFDGMEVTKRQKTIWNFVRAALTKEEAQDISAIYARGMLE